jgi:hypothetical protein
MERTDPVDGAHELRGVLCVVCVAPVVYMHSSLSLVCSTPAFRLEPASVITEPSGRGGGRGFGLRAASPSRVAGSFEELKRKLRIGVAVTPTHDLRIHEGAILQVEVGQRAPVAVAALHVELEPHGTIQYKLFQERARLVTRGLDGLSGMNGFRGVNTDQSDRADASHDDGIAIDDPLDDQRTRLSDDLCEQQEYMSVNAASQSTHRTGSSSSSVPRKTPGLF